MASKRKIMLEPAELAWLCEQIALIQRSGILLPEGIELLAESADIERLKTVLNQLAARIQKMVPLSDAMQDMASFPPYLVRMVRIGEISGNLDQVLSGLSDFYMRDSELRKKVRSALVYPLVLLFMMLAIILLLVVRVLPVFSQILASFGGTMPPFSQGLLSFGNFMARHALWLIPLMIIVVAGVWLWLRQSGGGRRFVDKALLNLPVIGPVYRRLYASRFSISLHYLLRSGVDLDAALSLTESVMDNSIVSGRIAESRAKIKLGEDTFAALQEMELFPRLFVRMLALGSRAGELDVVMSKLANAYENEVNNRLTRLTGLVEPFLVIILSLIVGGILLTVMLPLVEIMSSIG
jgi:type IV pilus assembly protein PilC